METNVFNYLSNITHSVKDEYSWPWNDKPKERYSEIDKSSDTINLIPNFVEKGHIQKNCPYCGSSLISESKRMEDIWSFRGPGHGRTITTDKYGKKCLNCNWWYVVKKVEDDDDAADRVLYDTTVYEGIICRFPYDLWRKSLELADNELSEYRRRLSSLSPKGVEQLVGEILSQYLQCEVRHVGRSHDDGIDLIIINGDEPIAVQVKHRNPSRKRKSEGVTPVREFVGAMVGNKFKKGIFFTTDERYSLEAKKYAEKVSLNFAPINLYTIREIRDFINNIVVNQWIEYERLYG